MQILFHLHKNPNIASTFGFLKLFSTTYNLGNQLLKLYRWEATLTSFTEHAHKQ